MSRIRSYETIFIVKPTLTEEEVKAQIDTVKANIEKNGGTIVSSLDMGMKTLAYEIEKNKRGHYYVIYFNAPTLSILELERIYRINENILRFMFVKYESKKQLTAFTKLVEEANKKSAK